MQRENWKKIISENSTVVWRSAYRLLGNDADASDCFQDTFVSAFEICRRQQVRNISALLKRLVTTRAMDLLRKKFRHQKYYNSAAEQVPVQIVSQQPLQNLQQQELIEIMRSSLAKLSEQEAAVFCLRYLDDMTYQQIADELGININAAGVILHRTKDRLKSLMKCSIKELEDEVI